MPSKKDETSHAMPDITPPATAAQKAFFDTISTELNVHLDDVMINAILKSTRMILVSNAVSLAPRSKRRHSKLLDSSITTIGKILKILDQFSDDYLSPLTRKGNFNRKEFVAQANSLLSWLEENRKQGRRVGRKLNVALKNWLYLLQSIYLAAGGKGTGIRRRGGRKTSSFVDFAFAISKNYLPRELAPTSYASLTRTWEVIRPKKDEIVIDFRDPAAYSIIWMSKALREREDEDLRTLADKLKIKIVDFSKDTTSRTKKK